MEIRLPERKFPRIMLIISLAVRMPISTGKRLRNASSWREKPPFREYGNFPVRFTALEDAVRPFAGQNTATGFDARYGNTGGRCLGNREDSLTQAFRAPLPGCRFCQPGRLRHPPFTLKVLLNGT
jgi:hypothetical protein